MIEMLPYYYRKSKITADFYDAVQKMINRISTDIEDKDLSLFITTTSDFALHEKDVGLSEIIADNETKRARVLARLQGNNPLTKTELERLVLMYDKTGCTITEDFAAYTVRIAFIGRKGKPHNLAEITAAIDEVKPAHLRIEYNFSENTWADVRKKLGTWGNAKAFTWGGIKEYDGRTWLYADGENVYLRENGANAYAVLIDDVPYARML